MVIGILPTAALATDGEENIPIITGELPRDTETPDSKESVLPDEGVPGYETPVEEPVKSEDSVESEDDGAPEGLDEAKNGYLSEDESADAIGEYRDENGDDFATPSSGELLEVHFDDSVNANIPTILAEDEFTNTDVIRYTVLLLDCSGSMRNTPIVKMRAAATKFCEQVLQANGTNYVAIVPFSDSNKTTTEFTSDLDTLKTAIGKFSATGGTNINDALLHADELLSAIPDSAQTIKNVLLLSDGLPENGASNSNGRYTAKYSSIFHYRYADGEKVVLLPSDTDYTISMRATGEGEVNYAVEEYNLDTMSIVRVLQYETVEVDIGDTLTADVPVFSQAEQDNGIPTGSTVTYTLSDNGKLIDYTNIVGTPAEYAVEVMAEDTGAIYGLVSGGGFYTEGSFAQVEAYPLTDSSFTGWYDEGGTLVSAEKTYRFAVTENTTLVAHFDEVETYQLTVKAQNGGSVANAYQIHVPAGVYVAMEASPNTGYTFAGWISDSGSFENRYSLNTQFIMPSQDAVVTATFNGTTPEGSPNYSSNSSSDSDPTYSITVSRNIVGGTIKVSPTSSASG